MSLGLAAGPADSTVVSGSFTGHIDLDSVIRSSPDRDGFLVRLSN